MVKNDMLEETSHGTMKNLVHSKIRNRLLIYSVISLILIVIIAYRIILYGGGIFYPLMIFVIGILVGTIVARMYKIQWDKDAERVVSRLDAYGAVFLSAYIMFEFFGERFIKSQFTGHEIYTIIFSLISGVLLGRGIGMAGKIRSILREQDKLE